MRPNNFVERFKMLLLNLFPQAVSFHWLGNLCGVRDVRDYRLHSAQDKAIITGGSAFNIKAASLRLGDFSGEGVCALYKQHTDETGQVFVDGGSGQ